MKITDLHIDGFGIWSDLTVESVAPSMTVFYGPNEAGKSTLMQFVRTVLYGFSPERRERYVPPVHGGRCGGSLGVMTLAGRYRIERYTSVDAVDSVGEARLIAADGSAQREAAIQNLLAGIDESIFTNVFAIGLRELQELATLNDTEAAQQLYKLSSGMDRVSLVDVMYSLDKSRAQLLARDGRPARLTQLLAERDRLRSRIDQQLQLGRRWARLAAERRELEQAAHELEEKIRATDQRSRIVHVAAQVRERWLRRRAIDQQLAEIPSSTEIALDALRKLDRLNRVIAERNKRLESLKSQRDQLRAEERALPWNPSLWRQRAKLEALTEHAAWIDSLGKHIEELSSDIERLNQEWKQTCQELEVSPQNTNSSVRRLDHRVLMALRGPARAVRDETRRLQQIEQERETVAQQVGELTAQLELELSERGHEQLSTALDRAADLAEKLRRRIQVEERLEKLNRHKKELDEDHLEFMRTPIMPFRQMAAWGSIVAFGVMLIMISLFSDFVGENRIPVVFFGMLCTAGGFLLKHAYQQISTQELDECQRQLALVKRHIQQAMAERDELDAALPPGGGPLESRLKKAEEDLKRLEYLQPIEQNRAHAQERLEETDRRLKQARAALKEARQRWRAALRKLNLSDDLTPGKLRHLVNGHERLTSIQRALQAKRQEKEQRENDLLALAERIGEVLREAGLKPDSDDPRLQIRQMAEAIAEQQRIRERRNGLRQQQRAVRRQRERCLRSIEKLRLRRQAMFTKVGTNDETEFRQLAAEQALRRQLQQERQDLEQQIRLAVGAHCSLTDVEAELAADVDLARRGDELARELQQIQQQRAQLHQQQGEIQQEMKSLAGDREADLARLELACVEEQLARARRQWKLLGVTGLALEDIRRIYETERQPETLNEASTYLAALTEGRYQRIWTPLGKSALRVDDGDGRPLSIELLSQGTREAIFLSLRLALVAAYTRRGADLPLILDDVLVNLDDRRARAAAEVLRDFAAQGHQILLFTCHEHLAKMFSEVGADTRRLPARNAQGVVIERSLPVSDATVSATSSASTTESELLDDEESLWKSAAVAIPMENEGGEDEGYADDEGEPLEEDFAELSTSDASDDDEAPADQADEDAETTDVEPAAITDEGNEENERDTVDVEFQTEKAEPKDPDVFAEDVETSSVTREAPPESFDEANAASVDATLDELHRMTDTAIAALGDDEESSDRPTVRGMSEANGFETEQEAEEIAAAVRETWTGQKRSKRRSRRAARPVKRIDTARVWWERE